MSGLNNTVVLIPAYEPDERFPEFLACLKDQGEPRSIIVVNDGSSSDKEHFFEEAEKVYGCDVITHETNRGYGRALKTGLSYFAEKYAADDEITGVITCDCDGQHAAEDVAACADLMSKYPGVMIWGARRFDKDVPFKSRMGNKITAFVFKSLVGMDVSDTQCGLRGIPREYAGQMAEVQGDSMEFTTSLLLEAQRIGLPVREFPIKTIYFDQNETSHFNPLLDSARVYSMIFKYLISSLSSSVIDLIAFSIFITITRPLMPGWYILVSTYMARVISCTYTFFFNRNIVFGRKEGSMAAQAMRFVILCIVQATASGLLTRALNAIIRGTPVIAKVIVDVFLFFVSYRIQNKWIFRNEKTGNQ